MLGEVREAGAGRWQLRIQAELVGTIGIREGPGKEERWAGIFIKYGLAKPAWHWSSRVPLRSVTNCLSVVGAGLQRCPPE